ncbi:hypothetical protein O3M35_003021 [Rhynocoris fuscipes]|uniref:Uncharacterized protein n=1 Tax=Rhynocoris fuscipes TaxID=488301 RepID=A0AAW1CQ35_9HEMI
MADTLSPDTKELVINNFQIKFPSIVDRRIIYRVLENENWNFEKAFHIFQKLHKEFSKSSDKGNSNEAAQSNAGNNVQQQTQSQQQQQQQQQQQKAKRNKTRSKNKKSNNDESKKVGNNPINKGHVHPASMQQQTAPVFLDPNKRQMPIKGARQQDQAMNDSKLQKNKVSRTELKKSYDLIKHIKDPFDRIVQYTRARIKVMVFMRGCSGSGKSTYARELLSSVGITDQKWYIFSADDYFVDDSNGSYKYSSDLIVSAHEWNQALVRQAACEGRSPLVIDNTHTRLWEMKDNAAIGVEYGYVIETLEPKTPWFFVEAQLFRKSSHRVSRETIQRMLDRYEANITGADIISKLRLNYKQLPPIKQTVEFNTPPSRGTLKLYSRKNNKIPQNSAQSNYETKFNVNRTVPLQFQQQPYTDRTRFQRVNPQQMINDQNPSNDLPRFNQSTDILSNIPTPRWIEEQNYRPKNDQFNVQKFTTPAQSNFTTSTLSNIPSIFCGPNLTLQSPNSFLQGNNSGATMQTPTQFTSESNKNNLQQTNADFDSITSSFDLINLEDEQDLLIQDAQASTSKQNQFVSSNYLTDLKQLSFNTNNNSSDSDDTDVDEENYDEDDDDGENSSINSENHSSSNTSFDELDFLVNTTNSNVNLNKNLCQEYVLIQPNKTVIFQKYHNNAPSTLNDFITNYIDDSDKQNLNEETEPLLQTDNETVNDEKENDNEKDLVEEKIDNNFDNFISEYLTKSAALNENSSVTRELGNEAAAVFIASESVQMNKSSNDASSNTNHNDFDILKRVNNMDYAANFANNIRIGNPWFESAPFVSNTKAIPSSVLMLDKSSMTQDVETNHINNSVAAVDSLQQMFPTIKREHLDELLNKCGNDLDWAVGLLLDSGHEMCEFTTTPELYQDNSSTTILDNDDSSKSDEIDLNATSAASTSSNGACSRVQQKKKRKIQVHLSEDSLNLLQNFQEKFQLSDEHYSENITKLRKHRSFNTIESIANNDGLTTIQDAELLPTSSEVKEAPSAAEDVVEEEEEEEERENDVALVLDKHLVVQLQNKFGGLISSNLIPDETVIHIPQSLARQFYSYTFDAIYEHLEEQQAVIDLLIREAGAEENDEDVATSQPSFQEIMDHEMALRMSQANKDDSRSNTMASTLSRTLLLERFPNFDPATLSAILEDANHSLHEATNLLSFAGHPVKTPEESPDQSPTKKCESTPLSRKEAVQQAQAYSDVAGKLYDMREDCLRKAEKAIAAGNKTVAVYYSEMAKWYMERIEQSNSLAASAMLNGYESATTLDLHFLQVPQALKVLDLFLDEKIRALKSRKSTVYIITGRGSHSPQGLCKIKAAVQIRLNKRCIPYSEQNPGMLKAKITKRALISYKKMEN